jgi:two-component system, chemotaxis family, chemotaxis protein CheY
MLFWRATDGPVRGAAERLMDSAVSQLNVLVVEDDDGMRQLLCRMLKRMDAAGVVATASGEQALHQLESGRNPVDIVIADWNMPGMSGLELFKRVRSAKPRMPFLLVTGRDDAASIVAARTHGIPAYVVKPVSPQELNAKIAFLRKNAG